MTLRSYKLQKNCHSRAGGNPEKLCNDTNKNRYYWYHYSLFIVGYFLHKNPGLRVKRDGDRIDLISLIGLILGLIMGLTYFNPSIRLLFGNTNSLFLQATCLFYPLNLSADIAIFHAVSKHIYF